MRSSWDEPKGEPVTLETTLLSKLPHNTPAKVVDVIGSRSLRRRLLELGFTEKVEVEIVGAAPFGDPLQVVVRQGLFSLRGSEADCVKVSL